MSERHPTTPNDKIPNVNFGSGPFQFINLTYAPSTTPTRLIPLFGSAKPETPSLSFRTTAEAPLLSFSSMKPAAPLKPQEEMGKVQNETRQNLSAFNFAKKCTKMSKKKKVQEPAYVLTSAPNSLQKVNLPVQQKVSNNLLNNKTNCQTKLKDLEVSRPTAGPKKTTYFVPPKSSPAEVGLTVNSKLSGPLQQPATNTLVNAVMNCMSRVSEPVKDMHLLNSVQEIASNVVNEKLTETLKTATNETVTDSSSKAQMILEKRNEKCLEESSSKNSQMKNYASEYIQYGGGHYLCQLCNVSASRMINFLEHLNGNRHRANLDGRDMSNEEKKIKDMEQKYWKSVRRISNANVLPSKLCSAEQSVGDRAAKFDELHAKTFPALSEACTVSLPAETTKVDTVISNQALSGPVISDCKKGQQNEASGRKVFSRDPYSQAWEENEQFVQYSRGVYICKICNVQCYNWKNLAQHFLNSSSHNHQKTRMKYQGKIVNEVKISKMSEEKIAKNTELPQQDARQETEPNHQSGDSCSEISLVKDSNNKLTGQQKPDAKTLCEVSKSVSVVSDKEKCLTPVSFISNAMMRPDCVNVSNVPADKTLTLINPATEFYCKICNITKSNSEELKQHKLSDTHKKAVDASSSQEKITTVPQYFGCEICNVHGLPFSSENVELHMNCKSHKYMKVFWNTGMWPGPIEKASEPQKEPHIFKFLDRKGVVLCKICNEAVPDGYSLFIHQQSGEHQKKLALNDLAKKIPVIYVCEICNYLAFCGKELYYHHTCSSCHIEKAEKLASEDYRCDKTNKEKIGKCNRSLTANEDSGIGSRESNEKSLQTYSQIKSNQKRSVIEDVQCNLNLREPANLGEPAQKYARLESFSTPSNSKKRLSIDDYVNAHRSSNEREKPSRNDRNSQPNFLAAEDVMQQNFVKVHLNALQEQVEKTTRTVNVPTASISEQVQAGVTESIFKNLAESNCSKNSLELLLPLLVKPNSDDSVDLLLTMLLRDELARSNCDPVRILLFKQLIETRAEQKEQRQYLAQIANLIPALNLFVKK